MRRIYQERSEEIRDGLVARIEALLGLRIARPVQPEPDYGALLDRLAAQLSEELDAPGRALVAALSSNRERPVWGFVDDLAEVLFLPRERRSEYVQNRQVAPPYAVRKLLLEYAVWAHRLDELVGVLNKEFCASRCDKLPVGCCHILGYDLGLVPAAMLDLQWLEAVRNGWHPSREEDKCRYHTDAGCVLALFKAPACIGYLCEPLKQSLVGQYRAGQLGDFFERLAVFRNCDLDRRKVFEAMEATVVAGRRLIASGAGPTSSGS